MNAWEVIDRLDACDKFDPDLLDDAADTIEGLLKAMKAARAEVRKARSIIAPASTAR